MIKLDCMITLLSDLSVNDPDDAYMLGYIISLAMLKGQKICENIIKETDSYNAQTIMTAYSYGQMKCMEDCGIIHGIARN